MKTYFLHGVVREKPQGPQDIVPEYFAWYDNQSDPTGQPAWEGAGWYEGTPDEAAKAAKADGCAWTQVIVTQTTDYPTPGTILARA